MQDRGVNLSLTPHCYTILPPVEAQCSPKRRKSFELHFPKESSHCSPTLTSFYPLGSPTLASFHPPGSPTLTSINSLNLLAPIPEDCQSWTHNLCTLSCVTLSSRPSMLVQLLTVYIYKKYLLELPHHNKLPTHSYIVLPPLAAQLLHHFTPSEQITPSLLHHFTPLGSPTLTSF